MTDWQTACGVYECDRCVWVCRESRSIQCYKREHPFECHDGCGHLETCAVPLCASFFNHGAAETVSFLSVELSAMFPTSKPIHTARHSRICRRLLYCWTSTWSSQYLPRHCQYNSQKTEIVFIAGMSWNAEFCTSAAFFAERETVQARR